MPLLHDAKLQALLERAHSHLQLKRIGRAGPVSRNELLLPRRQASSCGGFGFQRIVLFPSAARRIRQLLSTQRDQFCIGLHLKANARQLLSLVQLLDIAEIVKDSRPERTAVQFDLPLVQYLFPNVDGFLIGFRMVRHERIAYAHAEVEVGLGGVHKVPVRSIPSS